MCGFVAFLQNEPMIDLETARRAQARIAHRGPDAAGEWHERNVMLLHRRLSIIDLESGLQPMVSSDGRYVIVFNGEIYNFQELRGELEQAGSHFRTRSDTEVILEGYRYWGERVVERLNGMFAFVIWDRCESVAFGARDRLGIKPLCWAIRRGGLIVSSTLEPFGALEDFDRIDPVAARDFLTFDYISSPRSILMGVKKLDPGCRFMWRVGANEIRSERYWSPPLRKEEAYPLDEFELETLLEQAVKRQMISDVPIGVFLSGGIDSSLLVALMARQSGKPIRTFSVSFNDPAIDESSIAGLVARQFGTDHTVLPAEDLGPDMLLDLLGRLDEPFADPAVVPTYALSKMTRSHVKVALSGDGGDEVFGGYPKYLSGGQNRQGFCLQRVLHQALCALPWRPPGLSHVYWRTLSSQDLIRWAWVRYGDFPVFGKDLRQILMPAYHESARVSDFFESWEHRAKRYGSRYDTDLLMRTDLETYLSENCLVKTDRASMLASLEVRVPFLDNVVLDHILPLPAESKIVNGRLKALLLPIAHRILPKEVWNRPKQGFAVPFGCRLKGDWRPAVEAVFDWGEDNIDLFNMQYLRKLHHRNLNGNGVGRELWDPFVFLAWAMAHRVKV
jgi:asparagine synthase (glutamine-hydrolysing)